MGMGELPVDVETTILSLNSAAGDALNMFISGPPEEGGHVSEEAVKDALRTFKADGGSRATG
jgi:hypothetical protein